MNLKTTHCANTIKRFLGDINKVHWIKPNLEQCKLKRRCNNRLFIRHLKIFKCTFFILLLASKSLYDVIMGMVRSTQSFANRDHQKFLNVDVSNV